MPAHDNVRPFPCRCGWVLGEIYRTAKHVTMLRTYRQAQSEVFPGDYDRKNYGVLDLLDGGVVCSHCGNVQPWCANQSALDDLLARRSNLVNLQEKLRTELSP